MRLLGVGVFVMLLGGGWGDGFGEKDIGLKYIVFFLKFISVLLFDIGELEVVFIGWGVFDLFCK